MKRTISFGKIAYYGNRKENEVEIKIELRLNKENKPVLSICGNIWNRIHSDILAGGQCLDTIAKYKKTPLFKEIYVFWQKYHLNDMHPGTEKQEKALEDANMLDNYDYTKCCKYLKSINLFDDSGYKYGHGFIYREIPENDLNRIKEIINEK